jgi:addiction module HigA family antidote
MAISETYSYKPDYVTHPGEYLEEVIKSRDLKNCELSGRLGISEKHLSQIVNTESLITSDLALKLEITLGISANIWNNLNANFSLFQARKKENEILLQNKEWVKNFPVKDLINNGFLPKEKNAESILKHLLAFFAIPSPEQWERYYKKTAIFRKSDAFKEDCYHVISWLRAGEIMAKEILVNPFSEKVLRKNLKFIRGLTCESSDTFVKKMQTLCAESGVALVFLPEFAKTHIYGASYWINAKKAIIIMSLRYKTNDHFWFTFFHEAAHILYHSKKEVFIEDSQSQSIQSNQEIEANKFAENILIPVSAYRNFLKTMVFRPYMENDIKRFAKELKIHPAIVVGRLQHDKKISFKSSLNTLKERVEFNPNLMV